MDVQFISFLLESEENLQISIVDVSHEKEVILERPIDITARHVTDAARGHCVGLA